MVSLATTDSVALVDHEGGPKLKIAILLPSESDLRTIRRASELAAALHGAQSTGRHLIEIAVGVSEKNDRKWQFIESQIKQRVPSAVVRHLEWTRVPTKNVRRMFAQLPPALDLEGISEVTVPRDWGWNFQDCDLWLSMAEPGLGAILPLRPVTHYRLDLAQRYVPSSIANSIHDPYWRHEAEAFRVWRQGLVVTSDPGTGRDLTSYAGVRRERIEIIPDLLDGLEAIGEISSVDRDPFLMLWLLRGNAVDDLENGLLALSAYLREGGILEPLLAFDVSTPALNHLGAAALPSDLLQLYQDLPRFGYHSLEDLDRMLARAGALWSSQLAGGQAEHIHDAVRAGLPILAPDFDVNAAAAERLGARASLYPMNKPNVLADMFHALEASLTADPTEAPRQKPVDSEGQRAAWGFLIDRMLEHNYDH